MMRTFNITADVQPNRQVLFTLPFDMPTGLTEMVVVIGSQTSSRGHTLGNLLHSEFIGMWRDREDIIDSAEFALELRKEAWKRSE